MSELKTRPWPPFYEYLKNEEKKQLYPFLVTLWLTYGGLHSYREVSRGGPGGWFCSSFSCKQGGSPSIPNCMAIWYQTRKSGYVGGGWRLKREPGALCNSYAELSPVNMVIFTVKVTIVDTDTSLALPVHCVPLYICALPQVLCQTEPRGQFGRSAGRRCACSPTLVYSHQGRGVTWVPGGEPGPSCGKKGDCKGNCVPTGQQGLKRDSETGG